MCEYNIFWRNKTSLTCVNNRSYVVLSPLIKAQGEWMEHSSQCSQLPKWKSIHLAVMLGWLREKFQMSRGDLNVILSVGRRTPKTVSLSHYLEKELSLLIFPLITNNGRKWKLSSNISYEMWLFKRKHTWTIFTLGTIYIGAIYTSQLLRNAQLLTQRNHLIHRSCWFLLMGCTLSALPVCFKQGCQCKKYHVAGMGVIWELFDCKENSQRKWKQPGTYQGGCMIVTEGGWNEVLKED